jgi:hypothetical protein
MGEPYNEEPDSGEKCPNSPPGDGAFGDYLDTWGVKDIHIRAIELTVRGWKDTEIAENLRIDRKTLWRWKNWNPDYRAALLDARMQNFAEMGDQYQSAVKRATAVLEQLLDDPASTVRYRAAQTLVTMAGSFKPQIPKGGTPATSGPPEPDLPEKVG